MAQTAHVHSEATSYGLRREAFSPMETIVQSESTIAPTATPVATIPLVFALAGNGTWLAYVLATSAVLLVALCVSKFARSSTSPGSLYSHASMVPRQRLEPSPPGACYLPTLQPDRASLASYNAKRCHATHRAV
jgi:hypothetical protein